MPCGGKLAAICIGIEAGGDACGNGGITGETLGPEGVDMPEGRARGATNVRSIMIEDICRFGRLACSFASVYNSIQARRLSRVVASKGTERPCIGAKL